MRILRDVFAATVLIAPVCFCSAQPAPNLAPAAPATPPATPAFTPVAPSQILQRSLAEVKQTVGAVRLERWKKGSVRDEAGKNIDAIQRNQQGTLQSLLKDADAGPATLSKVLPLSRNVDALYDVLVHLVEEARVSGTGEDAGQLQQALGDLEKGRVALDNQILQAATVQEKQVADLRVTVQKQETSLRAAASVPPPPKCPAPPPAKKRTTKPATTTKPASSTTPATGTKPATATSTNQPAKPQ